MASMRPVVSLRSHVFYFTSLITSIFVKFCSFLLNFRKFLKLFETQAGDIAGESSNWNSLSARNVQKANIQLTLCGIELKQFAVEVDENAKYFCKNVAMVVVVVVLGFEPGTSLSEPLLSRLTTTVKKYIRIKNLVEKYSKMSYTELKTFPS